MAEYKVVQLLTNEPPREITVYTKDLEPIGSETIFDILFPDGNRKPICSRVIESFPALSNVNIWFTDPDYVNKEDFNAVLTDALRKPTELIFGNAVFVGLDSYFSPSGLTKEQVEILMLMYRNHHKYNIVFSPMHQKWKMVSIEDNASNHGVLAKTAAEFQEVYTRYHKV